MLKKQRLVTKKVNIYDGQRVTESDLDTEQIHNNSIVSNLAIDFHGSGVVKDNPLSMRVLLDTSSPLSSNPSIFDINSGNYDGKVIRADVQPSDPEFGNRIEVTTSNVSILGRRHPKIMILGKAYSGDSSNSELVIEFMEFLDNKTKLSKYYYQRVIGIFTNNFSGGSGRTETLSSADNLNLISDGGKIVITEAEPLKAFSYSRNTYQDESPNLDLINFVTSSPLRTIRDEIELALGASDSIGDLYLETEGKSKIKFEKGGASSISYGQKFLSKSNNLQRIDILMAVERDLSLPLDQQLDFSGDLVLSVYELQTEINCSTNFVPNDMIDFDPEITPLAEVSVGQNDLEILGFKLNETSQVVSFNFAGTLLANPNIEPSLVPGRFYAFSVSRRGDNRTGTIVIDLGFDKVFKKSEDGVPLTVTERFLKQESKFFQYDPATKRFVNDSNSSLWHIVYSDDLEVTNGTAYTSNGVAVTLEKTETFIGETRAPLYRRNIPLRNVSEGSTNYLVMNQVQKFTDPGTHPRTNNFVYTRIVDAPYFSVVTAEELSVLSRDYPPIILAKVSDKNVRDAQPITGTMDKPGLAEVSSILILNPGQSLLSSNLVNRIIIPDTGCNCNAFYRIASVECFNFKAGDLNSDDKLTVSDLSRLLDLVGNTINSTVTQASIFGGELSIIDFIKSDLNNDGTVDGTDIELLEDAIDGYVNFSIPKEIRAIRLNLENIFEEDNNPIIFEDTLSSGSSIAATSQIAFVTSDLKESLAIQIDDIISIPAPSLDAGDYVISSRSVSPGGTNVSVTVTALNGDSVSFIGSSGFNVVVTSSSQVNLYADNLNLIRIPYSPFEYRIDFVDSAFDQRFVDVCDLRRMVETSFVEEKSSEPCECVEPECLPGIDCSPVYKNQSYLPGDLYLPSGDILSAPGVPHHGDFEYVNITIPLPPGSIEDCSVDLYNTFIKSVDGSCQTAAGFNAMRFSDGTLVGCQDVGFDTDISKGRIKFSKAICSLFVDAAVDGYSDGYTEFQNSQIAASAIESISENFIDFSYTSFSSWALNPFNDNAITTITNAVGLNEPAILDLATSSASGDRFGRLDGPVDIQSFSGDFILDFKASRVVWDSSSLVNGRVEAFGSVIITNMDGSTATLKLGWKNVGSLGTKLFYSGVIRNNLSVIISNFDYEIDAPDLTGDEVLFRLRRINDVVSAYYIIPGKLSEVSIDRFGQFVRIGSNPDMHPGTGTASFSYEVSQSNSPTPGLSFVSSLMEVIVNSDYQSVVATTSMTVGRDSLTNETDRATITLPYKLPRRTSILSANLSLTSQTSGVISDIFNIIPISILNADNIGRIFNLPLEQDLSLIKSFTPGAVSVGGLIDIDITSMSAYLISRSGHLPGFIKGLVIEPDETADSEFTFEPNVLLTIEYLDETTGVVYKVGMNIDSSTGIVTLNTKNILFDALSEVNRTVLNFGIYLKKSGFKNQDIKISINELSRVGIGTCFDTQPITEDECYFIVGNTATGTLVEGPFDCELKFP